MRELLRYSSEQILSVQSLSIQFNMLLWLQVQTFEQIGQSVASQYNLPLCNAPRLLDVFLRQLVSLLSTGLTDRLGYAG